MHHNHTELDLRILTLLIIGIITALSHNIALLIFNGRYIMGRFEKRLGPHESIHMASSVAVPTLGAYFRVWPIIIPSRIEPMVN